MGHRPQAWPGPGCKACYAGRPVRTSPRMQSLEAEDTTTINYWLNWRFLLCVIWIFSSMSIASFIIWKYERFDILKSDGETREDAVNFLHSDDVWRPCLKEIHPIWLLAFRVIAFCLLLAMLIVKVIFSGAIILIYYTQWTFMLVTIYFAFGSLLSMYGCYQYHKINSGSLNVDHGGIDAERGNFMPLANGECKITLEKRKALNGQDEFQAPGIISFLFQVIFQMNAGAVMLTDCIYWCIIFPFLTAKDYGPSFLTVNMHTLNAILLLGDTALNCVQFPWFRVSYFILWTSSYVIFQWIYHGCVRIQWPYPFLDLSSPYAPLWYLVVGLLHIPCYGIFALTVKIKRYLLSKWFPQSYRCLR
ncbi:hypothetical protein LWI28_027976 [Acer negundo]|uniref:Uncharacterized protein n=1 Tax=Acer negundo TaxID=4023 RepID=A0AAD5IX05_ACENE|nr:hypothetical protein LWI28_027976 [Acer negundo]